MKYKIIELPKIEDDRGSLSIVEENNHIPFKIERVYWISDMHENYVFRGFDLKEQQGFIVALSGEFDIVVDDGKLTRVISLNQPHYGLYIPRSLFWKIENFSKSSVAMIFSSAKISGADYKGS